MSYGIVQVFSFQGLIYLNNFSPVGVSPITIIIPQIPELYPDTDPSHRYAFRNIKHLQIELKLSRKHQPVYLGYG